MEPEETGQTGLFDGIPAPIRDFVKKWKWVMVAVTLVLAIIITFISVVNYRKGVENEGEAMQERVEQTLQNAQNSLSTCLDQGQVAAQVAVEEYKQLKDILTQVISARYVNPNGEPTSAEEAVGGGSLFSVIVEAYPTISPAIFENLQDVVVGCRDEYQGSQDRLFNEIQVFETWIQTDNFWNQGIKNNFPKDSLETVDFATGEIIHGQEALDYMSRVILVGEAHTAYQDGELPDQDLFGDDGK